MIRYRNSPEIVDALDRYLLTGTLSARVVQGGQQHLEAAVSSRVSCSLSVRYAEGRAQGFSPRRAGAIIEWLGAEAEKAVAIAASAPMD